MVEYAQSIQKVGVIGLGLMGSGIAQVNAMAGYEVVATDVSQEIIDKALFKVKANMERQGKKMNLSDQQVMEAFQRIHPTLDLANFHDCNLIVEAIIERVEDKQTLFRALDSIVSPTAIFASNTSSIPISDLSSVVSPSRRKNFVGLHHFNPVPVMKLVELVVSVDTRPEVVQVVKNYVESLGKTVVICKDTPAFIVNYLLIPYILDAIRLYEHGTATKEDIDTAIKLGLNHPMGPFELLDFVGLDTTLYIADIMFNEYREPKWAAPPLLRRLVKLGYHGRKTGRGFYTYPPKPSPP